MTKTEINQANGGGNEDGRRRRSWKNYIQRPSVQLAIVFHIFSMSVIALGAITLLAFNLLFQVPDPESLRASPLLQIEFTQIFMWGVCGALIAIGLISLTVGVIFSHRVVGPMVPILRHIDRLIAGDYETRIRLRENDEFKDVAERLNTLSDALRTTTNATRGGDSSQN